MTKSLPTLIAASLLLVGLSASPLPHAFAASAKVAVVPLDNWAYRAMDTLQKAGIVFGHPEGTYSGPPEMSRYEFAEATASLLPLLQTNGTSSSNKDASSDFQSKVDTNAAVIDALKQLVDGFAPELTALGQDVHNAKFLLDALEAREAARDAIVSRMRVKVDGHNMTIQNGTIPDLPVNQWVYQNIDTLQKAGIAIGEPDSTYSGTEDVPISWLAASLLLLLQLQRPAAPDLYVKVNSTISGADLQRKLVTNPDAVRCLTELVDAVAPWIREPRTDLLADRIHLNILRLRAATVADVH
jgi:hypothetical protein